MEGRRSNKLPEGVGKKIVEALKRQSGVVNKVQAEENSSSFDDLINTHITENESGATSYVENNSEWDNDYQNSDVTIGVNQEYDDEEFNADYGNDDDSSVEEFKYHEVIDEDDLDSYDYYKNNESEDYREERAEESSFSNQNFEENEPELEEYIPEKQTRIQPPQKAPVQRQQHVRPVRQQQPQYVEEKVVRPEQQGLYVDTSSNIEVLMNLVSQLPSGVTRQTMEAIGFSMNKVLKEAQFAQAELAQAIRDNINTIEEYRINIKTLEKDVQKYRRKAEELEDLISLFILSEKDRKK